jgi:hypothetical protein
MFTTTNQYCTVQNMNTHYTSNTVHVPVFLEGFPHLWAPGSIRNWLKNSECPYGNHRLVSGF